jgi:hypothetical protein
MGGDRPPALPPVTINHLDSATKRTFRNIQGAGWSSVSRLVPGSVISVTLQSHLKPYLRKEEKKGAQ